MIFDLEQVTYLKAASYTCLSNSASIRARFSLSASDISAPAMFPRPASASARAIRSPAATSSEVTSSGRPMPWKEKPRPGEDSSGGEDTSCLAEGPLPPSPDAVGEATWPPHGGPLCIASFPNGVGVGSGVEDERPPWRSPACTEAAWALAVKEDVEPLSPAGVRGGRGPTGAGEVGAPAGGGTVGWQSSRVYA